jgi:four helix bundle protein
MALQVAELSFELIEVLRPAAEKIRRRDRSLADQLVRAASSVALNLAEGNWSDGGNRRARFHTAAGSASETAAALRVGVGWGYLSPPEVAAADQLVRRILAILAKLTRG